MASWIKMPLDTDVGLVPGHSVRWGPNSRQKRKGHSPQLLAHVCCGQTAGLIKMPLGMDVGFGAGDGWLVGWGLTALLTQNRSYRACRFVGIFYSKL